MTSKYISHQKTLAEMGDRLQERRERVIAECMVLPSEALPPLSMVNKIGSHDQSHFLAAMTSMFNELVIRAHVVPASNILDMGCGCGRIALPFAKFLDEGSYYGIDVWPEGIAWCSEHIAKDHPRSRFECLESADNYYFSEEMSNQENSYSLDFVPSESLDLAFAISLFTHLREDDCASYFREIARTLRPGGIAYLTAFIIDVYFYDYVGRTKKHRAVTEVAPGCFHAYAGQDFFSGFTMRKWRELLEEAGLHIVSFELGQWAEKPGSRLYQDTFIIMRTPDG